MYRPKPIDTSDVALPEELLALTEKIAENVHDVWAAGRIAEGWVYGEKKDAERKTTPLLIPYDELPEGEKDYDRNTAVETLKLIVKMGYRIEKRATVPIDTCFLGDAFVKSFTILAGSRINREMISEAIQLDRISYGEVYQLQVDTCFDYFEKNNDIYIMAVDNESGHVIGYINFSPIKEEVYTHLASGSVVDTVITGDDVLPYEDGICYWGYFSSIVVHPEYRQHGIATKMLLCWSDLVFRLATNRSIFFKGIVADAVSDVGVHLLSEIGFSFAKSSTHESKIMTLNLFSEEVVHSKYNNKVLSVYKEYKERKSKRDAVQV